jgi:hypothetical protein
LLAELTKLGYAQAFAGIALPNAAMSVGGKRRYVLTQVNLTRPEPSTQQEISECFD